MNTILKPIAPDTQIEDTLFGQQNTTKETIKQKAKTVSENLNNIVRINGDKAYDVVIDTDFNNLYYNLEPIPEELKNLIKVTENKEVIHSRKYYYPIQYALIELNIN